MNDWILMKQNQDLIQHTQKTKSRSSKTAIFNLLAILLMYLERLYLSSDITHQFSNNDIEEIDIYEDGLVLNKLKQARF